MLSTACDTYDKHTYIHTYPPTHLPTCTCNCFSVTSPPLTGTDPSCSKRNPPAHLHLHLHLHLPKIHHAPQPSEPVSTTLFSANRRTKPTPVMPASKTPALRDVPTTLGRVVGASSGDPRTYRRTSPKTAPHQKTTRRPHSLPVRHPSAILRATGKKPRPPTPWTFLMHSTRARQPANKQQPC